MHNDYDDAEKLPELPPAPMDARIKAGAFDLAVLLVIMALYFGVPLMLGGLTLPMWGVFAAVVGYSVAPLAIYRSTIGMKLFGLEMATRKGHAVPVTDLLFRELIGRGFFPIAYLGTLTVGFIAGLLGIGRFMMPAGFGAILFHLSWILLGATTIGHFLVFTRPDRRSLADLFARTVVTPRRAEAPLPTDEDERQDALRARSGRVRNLIIAEVLILMFGSGLPWLLTRKTPGENSSSYTDRLKRQKLEHQFQQDPTNARLANDLIWSYRGSGDEEEAERIRTAHREAIGEREKKREASLRERVAKNPTDSDAVWLLMEVLDEQNRMQEAKEVYRAWLKADFSTSRQAGFGIWLYQNHFSEESVQELTAAFDAGFEDAESYAYRGFAHRHLKQLDKAKADFEKALELDPELYEVEEALAALGEAEAPSVAEDVP